MSERELAIAGAAVRQFGYSFGPQHPSEVPAVMERILREFPDTPLAKIAQHHIEEAAKLAKKSNLTGQKPAVRSILAATLPVSNARSPITRETSIPGYVSKLLLGFIYFSIFLCLFLFLRRMRRITSENKR